MTKKIFTIRLGLAALLLVTLCTSFAGSSFASTPLAINTKDVDAAGRRPFQTTGAITVYATAGNLSYQSVVTVPANQRLIVRRISGFCSGISGFGASIGLMSRDQAQTQTGYQFLGKDITLDFSASNQEVEFYVNPGEELGFQVFNPNGQDGVCSLTATGYFMNLP